MNPLPLAVFLRGAVVAAVLHVGSSWSGQPDHPRFAAWNEGILMVLGEQFSILDLDAGLARPVHVKGCERIRQLAADGPQLVALGIDEDGGLCLARWVDEDWRLERLPEELRNICQREPLLSIDRDSIALVDLPARPISIYRYDPDQEPRLGDGHSR